MRETFISKNENETFLIAKNFATRFLGGEVLALYGDLGAGKTVFTKGIAAGLKINDLITSPTFTITNSYEGRLRLNHFDMYRINDENEVYDTGFFECLDGIGVCVVEWAEKIERLLPQNTVTIYIKKLENDTREITINENIDN